MPKHRPSFLLAYQYNSIAPWALTLANHAYIPESLSHESNPHLPELEGFSRTSPWRAHCQWLWSCVSPDDSPGHGIQLVECMWQLNSLQTTLQARQLQLLKECFPFIFSTDIFALQTPFILLSFCNIPGKTPTCGTAFAAMTWAILTPLVMIFTMTTTHLLPVVILV